MVPKEAMNLIFLSAIMKYRVVKPKWISGPKVLWVFRSGWHRVRKEKQYRLPVVKNSKDKTKLCLCMTYFSVGLCQKCCLSKLGCIATEQNIPKDKNILQKTFLKVQLGWGVESQPSPSDTFLKMCTDH